MCRRPGGVDFGGVQGVVGCEEGVAVKVVVGGGGQMELDSQYSTVISRGPEGTLGTTFHAWTVRYIQMTSAIPKRVNQSGTGFIISGRTPASTIPNV